MEEEPDLGSVLANFDEVFAKLRVWAPQALKEIGAQQTDIDKVNFFLGLDTLVHIPTLKRTFQTHGANLTSGDEKYIREHFLPPEYRDVEIPQHLLEKGLLYIEVFAELLAQLPEVAEEVPDTEEEEE